MRIVLNISVLQGGVVSTSPNPQAGWPPLIGCSRLLIQFIRSYPPYRMPFLYPQPEDTPCRGDRDPLHGTQYRISTTWTISPSMLKHKTLLHPVACRHLWVPRHRSPCRHSPLVIVSLIPSPSTSQLYVQLTCLSVRACGVCQALSVLLIRIFIVAPCIL